MADDLDIMHLDMDCFFAAVEVRERPELVHRPVVVGGTSTRGVVASASYEARAFGIRSAMSTVEAHRRCPDAIFIPPRHDLYGQISAQLLGILRTVTPLVEPVAMDEAYLDVGGAHQLFGDTEAIAVRLRREVRRELDLRCSVGIGRTKLVAKLASREAKPSARLEGEPARIRVVPGAGVYVVGPAEEAEFLRTRPLRSLPGIGPKTAERLRGLGITNVGAALEVGRERLCRLFGQRQGGALFDVFTGVDPRRVVPERAARSIGHETTFSSDIYDPEVLEYRLREFAGRVVARTREHGRVARTVTVKLRYGDFRLVTRSATVDRACTNSAVVAEVAMGLLRELPVHAGVRLLGLHLSNFVELDAAAPTQLELFAQPSGPIDRDDARSDDLDQALDAVRRRFGDAAVDPLSALSYGSRRSDRSAPRAP